MSKQNVTNYVGGTSFIGLLTIVFIVLKLTGHISWFWLWVLSPLWIPFLLILMIFAIVAIAAFVVSPK